VNNAGIINYGATIEHVTPEVFDREFAINVKASLFVTQRALPLLHDGGHIINISSGVTWFATQPVRRPELHGPSA
jgi:3-oxoacyl-[acyl-carrier protein] reductase